MVTPEDAPCYGLYISFAGREAPYQVQQMNRQGEWETVLQDSRLYANSYLPLPGLFCFRIAPDGGEDISIAEIHLFGEGEKPGWVQDWGRYANNIFGLCYSAVGTDEAMNDLFENLPEQ